jgi:hypothetical protein
MRVRSLRNITQLQPSTVKCRSAKEARFIPGLFLATGKSSDSTCGYVGIGDVPTAPKPSLTSHRRYVKIRAMGRFSQTLLRRRRECPIPSPLAIPEPENMVLFQYVEMFGGSPRGLDPRPKFEATFERARLKRALFQGIL